MHPEKNLESLNHGHRARLKEKFQKSKFGDLYDYEILELLLFLSHPRKDVKTIAKNLLVKFGTLSNTINADETTLKNFNGVGNSTIHNFRLVKEILYRANKEQIEKKNILSCKEDVIKYFRSAIGYKSVENIAILYLDSKNQLIDEEIIDYGTVNRVSMYIRETIKKTVALGATAIILCHNHPTNNTKPSRADIEMTNSLISALDIIEAKLHDHIIIGRSNYFSFKEKNLI